MKKLLLTLLVLLSYGFVASAETVVFQAKSATGVPAADNTVTFNEVISEEINAGLADVCDVKISSGTVASGFVRWFSGQTMTITPKTGVTINSISILCGNSKFGKITCGETSITTNSSNPNALFVNLAATTALTLTNGAQIRFSYMSIDFTKTGGGETPEPADKIELAVENLIVKAGEEALVADETYDLEKNATVTFAYETEENADITYSYIVNDEAEVESNSYTFTGEEDVFLTVKATSTNTVEKSFILNKWYPANCPAPKISLAVADTEVYAGKVITIDGNGADKTEWNVNGTPIDGTSYTITEAVGAELTFTVTNTTTVRVNGELMEKQSEITRTVTVVEKTEATFDFSNSGYGLTAQTDGSAYELVVKEISDGIVIINFDGDKYRYWNSDKTLRVQSGTTFTVSVPNEYYITSIDFSGTSASNVSVGTLYSGNWNPGDDMVSSVKFSPTTTTKIKTITVKYALRPTEIVNFTHDGIVSKAHVASLKYTLHVANHKDDSMYAVTLTLKDKDGVEVSATNEEHSLVEAPVAMAPARAATATHYLSGSVGFDDLTPEMTYTPTVSYGLKGAEPTGSVELPAITMLTTGIEDVTVDGNEAAEYFNLQGVRVAQPEAGRIYIVRRGAKVVKELVK